MEDKLNSEKLLYEIDILVKMYRINYLDAILLFCEKGGYDVEVIAKIIPSSLKTKLEETAKQLNLLKTKFNKAQSLPL